MKFKVVQNFDVSLRDRRRPRSDDIQSTEFPSNSLELAPEVVNDALRKLQTSLVERRRRVRLEIIPELQFDQRHGNSSHEEYPLPRGTGYRRRRMDSSVGYNNRDARRWYVLRRRGQQEEKEIGNEETVTRLCFESFSVTAV